MSFIPKASQSRTPSNGNTGANMGICRMYSSPTTRSVCVSSTPISSQRGTWSAGTAVTMGGDVLRYSQLTLASHSASSSPTANTERWWLLLSITPRMSGLSLKYLSAVAPEASASATPRSNQETTCEHPARRSSSGRALIAARSTFADTTSSSSSNSKTCPGWTAKVSNRPTNTAAPDGPSSSAKRLVNCSRTSADDIVLGFSQDAQNG